MGAGHNHLPAETDSSRMIPRMVAAAAILAAFFVIELTTSILINSMALLADAGHMLTDVVAVFMGLAAVTLARRGSSSPARTYGWHRAEVFTAVANAGLLIGVAMFILWEAFQRLKETPTVPGVPMIVVALAGLLANLVVALLLRSHSEGSLAVRGAYMEVVADSVSSVGVLIAGIVTVTTRWPYADVVVAVLVALWVLPRAESPSLVRCAVHMSLPGDSVHTCRSCTSVTPSTAPSALRNSSTSMWAGDVSDRIRSAARASETARGSTHSATSTATTTSAYGQRVVTV
ncbi:cation diffusion facilitator family transporter, partial [Mycobacterium sp. E2699]|uniref:cation diffusion facilitator family transporter n=1 Tax=Mycobacterium sp. E2699 TaxID=1834137 RepID=UPI000A871021